MGNTSKTAPWNPPPQVIKFIKENYGRMTKAALCRKFEIKPRQFENFIKKKGITANWEQNHKTKDLSGWQRVPVPGVGNPVLIIPPGRDPEKAKARYLEKVRRREARK